MAHIALAAEQGGAVGIRANGPDDIRDIKRTVKLPVVGLLKREIPGSDIYITPELEDVRAIIEAGADVVAMDMTNRENRPERAEALIQYCHQAGVAVMAALLTYEHWIVRAQAPGKLDLVRIDRAFFRVNVGVSTTFFAFVLLDRLLLQ